MKKLLTITALLITPLLLNACQSSDMNHSGMMKDDNAMKHENKMMGGHMKKDSMMKSDKMENTDMKKDSMMKNNEMKKGMM